MGSPYKSIDYFLEILLLSNRKSDEPSKRTTNIEAALKDTVKLKRKIDMKQEVRKMDFGTPSKTISGKKSEYKIPRTAGSSQRLQETPTKLLKKSDKKEEKLILPKSQAQPGLTTQSRNIPPNFNV